MLVHRMQEVVGLQRLQEELIGGSWRNEMEAEIRGIFPVDGHPANVKFARTLFENAGLDWLCEHESFSPLAMLSDTED